MTPRWPDDQDALDSFNEEVDDGMDDDTWDLRPLVWMLVAAGVVLSVLGAGFWFGYLLHHYGF